MDDEDATENYGLNIISLKSLNLPSKVDNNCYTKVGQFYTSRPCNKLNTYRNIKTSSRGRPQLQPSLTLLPTKGLVKLTALPEELRDPLNVFPATQYRTHTTIHTHKPYTTHLKETWNPAGSRVPLEVGPRRELTIQDLLQSTDTILAASDFRYVNPNKTSYLDRPIRREKTMTTSRSVPVYDLEKEITRSTLAEIRTGLQRCGTHI